MRYRSELIVSVLLFLLAVGTLSWAGEAAQRTRIDVGGHALAIECLGRGSPAVVLDAGLGQSARDWARIQRELATVTRVCAYDRAGYGASDPGPAPRTSRRIASELRRLLEGARVPPPYVLVGHSFGGYTARMFASLYPRQTAGMVLVDTPHEDQVEDFLESYFVRQLDPQGLLKQIWQPSLLNELAQLDLEPIAPLLGVKPGVLRAMLGEMAAYQASSKELRAAEAQPDIPLIAIMHGRRVLPAGSFGDQMEREWFALQRELVKRHENSEFIVAKNSAHNIPFTEPELIIEAVRRLIERQRR